MPGIVKNTGVLQIRLEPIAMPSEFLAVLVEENPGRVRVLVVVVFLQVSQGFHRDHVQRYMARISILGPWQAQDAMLPVDL